MSGHGSIQVNRDSTNSYSWMRDFFLTSVPEWLQEARTGICLSTGWTRWKMINEMLTKSRSVFEKPIGLDVHNLPGDSSLSFRTSMVTGDRKKRRGFLRWTWIELEQLSNWGKSEGHQWWILSTFNIICCLIQISCLDCLMFITTKFQLLKRTRNSLIKIVL